MSRKTGRPAHTRPVTGGGSRPPAARIVAAAAAVIVAALIGVGIGLQFGGPSATDEAVASLRQQEAQRDVAQIAELTARARQTAAVLNPIVDGLGALGTAPASAEQVQGWQKSLTEEVRWYSVTVSGMTPTNVARATLRSAVEQLSVAVDTVALAQSAGAGQREAQLALAGRQRGLAVAMWSVAATHLDQINVDAGKGHQHVYLQAGHEEGAMTGDGLPEGTTD